MQVYPLRIPRHAKPDPGGRTRVSRMLTVVWGTRKYYGDNLHVEGSTYRLLFAGMG